MARSSSEGLDAIPHRPDQPRHAIANQRIVIDYGYHSIIHDASPEATNCRTGVAEIPLHQCRLSAPKPSMQTVRYTFVSTQPSASPAL